MTYTGLAPFARKFIGDSGNGGAIGLVPAPAAGDTAAGKFLSANGTWGIPSGTGGGTTTIGTFDSQSPAANGAVISGTSLYMQSASATVPGLVNIANQVFSGSKKFTSQLQVATATNFLALGITNPTTYTSASTTANRTFTTPDADSNSVIPTTATASQWVTNITSGGVQTKAQPAFTDISGVAASAQLPTPTTSLIGGVKAYNATANQWINAIDTTGTPLSTQPAFSNISGQANLTTQVTGVLPRANGGLGVGTAPTDGQIPIASTSTGNYAPATLTAGSGVTITNAAGSITIGLSGGSVVSSLTGTANQVLVNGLTTTQTGACTLTLPQSIGTGSTPTFTSIILSSGATANYVWTSTNTSGAGTWQPVSALGVSSITGTANQVIASASSGAVTLSTPQDIGTTSVVQHGKIGIGSAVATSAILSCSSTTLGFLPPVMTTTQKNAISTPASGLCVYDSTLGDFQFYNGSSWIGATGATSATGTANQVLVNGTSGSAQTGALTFTTPQAIGTSSSPTFGAMTITNNLTAGGSVAMGGASITSGIGLNVQGTVASQIQLGFAWLGDISGARMYSALGGSSLSFWCDNSTSSGIAFATNTPVIGGTWYLGWRFDNASLGLKVAGPLSAGDFTPGCKLSVIGNAAIGFSSGQTGPTNGLIVNGISAFGTATTIANTALTISNTSNYALNIVGGIVYAGWTGTKTANYTVTIPDQGVPVDSSGGAITITLPATVPTNGWSTTIKDIGGAVSTNNITISGNGHNIDGSASVVLVTAYSSKTIMAIGGAWAVI